MLVGWEPLRVVGVETVAELDELVEMNFVRKHALELVRSLAETVRLDARTKMMSSGDEEVREIEKRLSNTMGWSTSSGMVDNWVYEEANNTFINDEEMQKRLLETNPNSFRKLVKTFL
uniref:CobN/magnesium chelatase domain-containing protein n=1 Tax=Physcomitrium patens TaxID=3218 RepID=A0A2K1KJZ1_PHYPA|nr:hypothetical protein PHYPA_007780 [Physcomitrium patens]